ncbi:MAG TPA: hypothetical protein VKT74_06910 [Gammaproteobacteria bacterium]|nr:hypothetical protein [Gammaproteobacteria bacterium]
MRNESIQTARGSGLRAESADRPERLKFAPDNGFQKELRRRVEASIREQGLKERDCPRMYFKTAVILSLFALFYVLLVFTARTWWQALPLAVLLGLAVSEIGSTSCTTPATRRIPIAPGSTSSWP